MAKIVEYASYAITLGFVFVAIIFGLGHTTNPNANAISILSSTLGGVVYTVAFLGARNIWFPWTLHFFWNAFQFLFGLPVSGMEVPQMVVLADIKDSALSGGAYGPEGGLVGIAARIFILAGILYYLKKQRKINLRELVR